MKQKVVAVPNEEERKQRANGRFIVFYEIPEPEEKDRRVGNMEFNNLKKRLVLKRRREVQTPLSLILR